MLHLQPSLPHVHLLVPQQLLRVHQEAPTLQTLVVLGLPHHGLAQLHIHVSLGARVDLLVDQHIVQGVEELVALAAHVLVLHVNTLRLLLLLLHAVGLCGGGPMGTAGVSWRRIRDR